MKKKKNTVRFFDLFAGIGGFREACRRFNASKKHKDIDFESAGWCEIDEMCQNTYNANFKNGEEFFADNIRNITLLEGEKALNYKNCFLPQRINAVKKNLPGFDLLFAGFPCQSFSSMGNEKSLEDERGSLFFDIVAILKAVRPKYFILENVRRILTVDNKQTIDRIMKVITLDLGYNADYCTLNSSDYGVPQVRRRVFFCGARKDTKLTTPISLPAFKGKPIIKKDPVRKILEKKTDDKYWLSEKILKTILSHGTGGYYQKSEIDRPVARPLTKTMHKMHRAHQDNYYSENYINGKKKSNRIRRLTPKEAFRLQGFDDSFVDKAYSAGVSDTQLYMQAGNSVTVTVVSAILENLYQEGWFRN